MIKKKDKRKLLTLDKDLLDGSPVISKRQKTDPTFLSPKPSSSDLGQIVPLNSPKKKKQTPF